MEKLFRNPDYYDDRGILHNLCGLKIQAKNKRGKTKNTSVTDPQLNKTKEGCLRVYCALGLMDKSEMGNKLTNHINFYKSQNTYCQINCWSALNPAQELVC